MYIIVIGLFHISVEKGHDEVDLNKSQYSEYILSYTRELSLLL